MILADNDICLEHYYITVFRKTKISKSGHLIGYFQREENGKCIATDRKEDALIFSNEELCSKICSKLKRKHRQTYNFEVIGVLQIEEVPEEELYYDMGAYL